MSKIPCLKADLNNITCKISCCISAEDTVDSQQEEPKKDIDVKHESPSLHKTFDKEKVDNLSSSNDSVTDH